MTIKTENKMVAVNKEQVEVREDQLRFFFFTFTMCMANVIHKIENSVDLCEDYRTYREICFSSTIKCICVCFLLQKKYCRFLDRVSTFDCNIKCGN